PAPSLTEDVLYPQLRKAHRSFADLLHRSAFQVFDSRFDLVGKEALFLFELEVASLPKASRHEGPPVWVKNSKDFLDKWRRSPKTMAGPYLHGERWAVDVTREATAAESLVKGKWADPTGVTLTCREAMPTLSVARNRTYTESFGAFCGTNTAPPTRGRHDRPPV